MSTPKEFFQKLADEPSQLEGLTAVFQFDITGDDGGKWYVDLAGDEPNIGEGTHDNPGCTIVLADEDLMAITAGTLDSQMAFMMGKIKISGDMALAMQLQKIFG